MEVNSNISMTGNIISINGHTIKIKNESTVIVDRVVIPKEFLNFPITSGITCSNNKFYFGDNEINFVGRKIYVNGNVVSKRGNKAKKQLKAHKLKKLFINVGLAFATIGLALSVGNIVTSVKNDKAKAKFVENFKNNKIQQTDDNQKVSSILQMPDSEVFKEARESDDILIQREVDELDKKDKIQKGHALGMATALTGMAAMAAGTAVAKRKESENEKV